MHTMRVLSPAASGLTESSAMQEMSGLLNRILSFKMISSTPASAEVVEESLYIEPIRSSKSKGHREAYNILRGIGDLSARRCRS